MRRLLALVAILVTTWSNAAMVRCWPTTPAPSESASVVELHANVGHTEASAPSAGENAALSLEPPPPRRHA